MTILRYSSPNHQHRRCTMPKDQYQTVKDIADRLKVAEATVRHWIRNGHLRAIDVGKGWRIADADLEDFLRAHETAPRRHGSGTGAASGPGATGCR
ncbi:helix-turn-helix domain-containing protein [Tabrizicola flagellatus]|uniref:helix-turn-helix domain-containing protein n=1 Tax=Tabrizicola flagellatus TaxID=2593021 RepID=UPI001F242DBC|nr:helix-turn-helix domain-containing protein [Tabrizicola flagellatus]